jgi:hypothetical protein
MRVALAAAPCSRPSHVAPPTPQSSSPPTTRDRQDRPRDAGLSSNKAAKDAGDVRRFLNR